MKTAQQSAQAWIDSSPRAQANYSAGVQAYSGDWANATTSQQAVMLANLNAAVNRGDWAAGVRQVGTTGWKSRTVDKIANFGVGFSAGAQRQASAIAKIIQAETTIVNGLPPRGTYDQNKARATAVMDQLHALKGTLGATG